MKEPWQSDYDSWLDNYGNPGIQGEEADEVDNDLTSRYYGIELACGHTVYGTETDIDSGIRKHNDYCEAAQAIADLNENVTENVGDNDEKGVR